MNIFFSREKIRVVVIDTIAGICNEFISNQKQGLTGVDTLERRNFLIKISQQLKKYAIKYRIAIVLINNMTSSINEDHDMPKKEKVFYLRLSQQQLIPCLGLLWSNIINERFKLKRLKGLTSGNAMHVETDILKDKAKRLLKSKFSPRIPKRKMEFVIEKDGLFGIYTTG